ncbi:MAG: helix-turn-helix domain-containing protein [Xanthomonadales bacterium]|nr:helix-turn-helix domain-containing protein [Xanthomonadales bacterium]
MNIASEKLKSLRQQKGWTQQHLAEVSGISLRTIQRAESSGVTSTDTIGALSAVFEVERSYWQIDTFTSSEKQRIIQKGLRIALISIALAQIISLVVIWLFVGTINSLWLKSILASWLVLGFCFFVHRATVQQLNIHSSQSLKALHDKFDKS